MTLIQVLVVGAMEKAVVDAIIAADETDSMCDLVTVDFRSLAHLFVFRRSVFYALIIIMGSLHHYNVRLSGQFSRVPSDFSLVTT